MSEPTYDDVQDENVPHEGAHAKAVDDQMERTSDSPPIHNVPAPGASYSQSEMQVLVGRFNAALGVLRDAELIPPEFE